jgi:hypothetical protein
VDASVCMYYILYTCELAEHISNCLHVKLRLTSAQHRSDGQRHVPYRRISNSALLKTRLLVFLNASVATSFQRDDRRSDNISDTLTYVGEHGKSKVSHVDDLPIQLKLLRRCTDELQRLHPEV